MSGQTQPFGINNAGTIVGDYFTPERARHQYIYKDGVYTSFDLPDSFGACMTITHGINASDAIVGAYRVARPHMPCGGPFHAYVRHADGTFSGFGATDDATSSEAWGINDQGDIVGQYDTIDGKTHGFLLRGNGEPVITIDFPNWNGDTNLRSIDNSGRIMVGNINTRGDVPAHTFKLSLCGHHCGLAP
ncbi:MAG TPA: hypothetical protein VHE78_06540 [Gemmatimonadaceae bacterium]|nr:hypothetical protein [Gemmatimonadaceae bacterium]